MDFKPTTPDASSPWASAQRRQSRIAHAQSDAEVEQPLQMYLLPPTGDVSLEEFDSLAVERLQVLRTFERAGHVGKTKYSNEWSDFVLAELKRQKLNTYFHLLSVREGSVSNTNAAEAQRRDLVSHFILRLAYCRTDELRVWFVQHELELFRFRFQKMMNQRTSSSAQTEVEAFLADNGIHLEVVGEDERDRLRDNLLHGTARLSGHAIELLRWYTVPFVEALELVRGRRVFLQGGLAYIPDRHLGSIVAAKFKSHLQHALAMARRLLPVVEEDSRLKTMLSDFDKRYTGRDYSVSRDANAVTPDMLDELSAQSYPPCMRQLHERLRSTHKLFHGGRLQYGLFLKAIGLSLDDAITFWRDEFTRMMDSEKFRKQYLYNIRHVYGQEGKRSSYNAQPCSKIIATGGSNDSGCPFKHYDKDNLTKMLSAYGVDKEGRAEVLELSSRGQPQLACQKYWELVHRANFDGILQHPNQWYEESRKTFAGPRTKTDRGVDKSHIIRATLPARSSQPSQPMDTSNEWDDDIDLTEEVQISLEMAASTEVAPTS